MRPPTRSRQAPTSSENKRGLLGHAAAGAFSTGRLPGDEAADVLSADAIKQSSSS